MKTKLRFVVLSLLTVTFNLSSQNVQQFLKDYKVEAACTRETSSGISDQQPVSFEIKMVDDESLGLLIVFTTRGIHNIYAPVNFTILDDQHFDIFEQSLPGPNFATEISGDGIIKGDSIFMQYGTKMNNVTYQCDCRGKKITLSDVSSLKANKYNVYVDAAKQQIVLDEALQNKSLIVELISLQGSIILQQMNTGESVNISTLSSGAYLLRIFQEGQVIYWGKILK